MRDRDMGFSADPWSHIAPLYAIELGVEDTQTFSLLPAGVEVRRFWLLPSIKCPVPRKNPLIRPRLCPVWHFAAQTNSWNLGPVLGKCGHGPPTGPRSAATLMTHLSFGGQFCCDAQQSSHSMMW